MNSLDLPEDPRGATKIIADTLFTKLYPLMLNIRNKLRDHSGALAEDEITKVQDIYNLCTSQIKKCLQTLFDIFKKEYRDDTVMQESRQCTIERLSWCYNKLLLIEKHLADSKNTPEKSTCNDDSIFVTPTYFVHWIDYAFDTLKKLAEVIYRSDYKDSEEICIQWKKDVVECVATLYISLDELLLSAMTLCKYCLPADQLVVKARCQVVLRESNALVSELIKGDLDQGFKATPESLKLPIMPSNVNVLIDVLKDVLYVLETNTNTALLALLIHCFSTSVSPVDLLNKHFMEKGECPCFVRSEDNDDCLFVNDFDLYNERLLQIGSFAVSCSSDQNRVLSLRSGLASLEALDPYLVPALMLSAGSSHAMWLMDSWRQEVREIRDNVFLIVDPAAFAEKSKQMMHHTLLELMRHESYNNAGVCTVINIGVVVYDFFATYTKLEPDALTHHEQLVPLLGDLNKVQTECKIVSNLLCSNDDFRYDVKQCKNKTVTVDQLLKRLKLLYTLVSKINSLLHPKEDEEWEQEDISLKDVTHTIIKNQITYVSSPKRAQNISRSIFARTTNIRSSPSKLPIAKLTKHLKAKMNDELSFSVQLDNLFNLSEGIPRSRTQTVVNQKNMASFRETSVLYNFSPNKRNSLRKAVLNRHYKMVENVKEKKVKSNIYSEKGSLMDEATSLQVTDILNQMSDMTTTFSSRPNRVMSNAPNPMTKTESNVLTINVNDVNTISKHIWSIPVNASTVEMPLDDSGATMASNYTQPSGVTTLERINDIDLVESKLNDLRFMEETNL